MQPSEISVAADRASLTIVWPDGVHQTLSAPTLRQISRSALSESARLKGWDVPAGDSLTITALEPVGVYAINITFSDGYAKGIYPWDMLRSTHDAAPVPGRTADHADAISELGN
ncbi:MAG: hypothetical protein CMM77_05335 [Rhodospirillaceae bacterium]|nr:hypothetical protein [Magnetovibrio sp.]MAY66530.1 hypothetical protein [Rhodospirillaceae bacterium]